MRRVLIALLVILVTYVSNGQFMEFGGGLGSMNYSGDLVRGFSFSTSSFAGTGFYRMNFSEYFTIRFGLTVGNVRGAETPIDPFAELRDHEFSTSVVEISSVFEYHFLDFKQQDSPVNYSPYIFGGFAILRLLDTPAEGVRRFQPVIPMGVGFKYLFNKKYTIGIEAGARKTFFDEIDGISDDDQRLREGFQYGNPKDDDWYFFSGITFSITLFNIPCPYPYTPNRSILSR
ncbi:MAG: DUF6089 family protein [Bacteroidota bacterium]